MEIKWHDGFEISVTLDEKTGEAIIAANREGMLSLSELFASLADEVPGSHIHLDRYNSLEDDSAVLIIARTE